MIIYIDTCCYNRPFDNLSHMAQPRVRTEAAALITTLDICKAECFDVIGSKMVMFEINNINNEEKLQNTVGLYVKTVTNTAEVTPDVKARVAELMAQGVKELDSYHVALAESINADYLLTTDDRLEKAAERLGMKVKVINPINFLQEYVIWLQSSLT